jgi:hypothetical protein
LSSEKTPEGTGTSFRIKKGSKLTPGMHVLTGSVKIILDNEQNIFVNLDAPVLVPEKLSTYVTSSSSYVTLN